MVAASPDYFSETGQLWGNPVRLGGAQRTGFFWWIGAFAPRCGWWTQLGWITSAASSPTGSTGGCLRRRAVASGLPDGRALFDAVRVALGITVAEDLGFITEDVTTLRRDSGYPAAVLQFAFDPAQPSSFLPTATSGTSSSTPAHDNNTTLGWYLQDASEAEGLRAPLLGTDAQEIHWDMIRAALASVAALAIVRTRTSLAWGRLPVSSASPPAGSSASPTGCCRLASAAPGRPHRAVRTLSPSTAGKRKRHPCRHAVPRRDDKAPRAARYVACCCCCVRSRRWFRERRCRPARCRGSWRRSRCRGP